MKRCDVEGRSRTSTTGASPQGCESLPWLEKRISIAYLAVGASHLTMNHSNRGNRAYTDCVNGNLHEAVSAWFLGPQAENADIRKRLESVIAIIQPILKASNGLNGTFLSTVSPPA